MFSIHVVWAEVVLNTPLRSMHSTAAPLAEPSVRVRKPLLMEQHELFDPDRKLSQRC